LNKTILFKSWIEVFVKGYFLNHLIPYSGVAYRGIQLKKYYDVSYTDYVGICYLFGMVGLILLLSSATVFVSLHFQAIVLITLLAALFFLIKFKFYFYNKIANYNSKNQRIKFYLEKFEVVEKCFNNILHSNKRYLFFLAFVSSLCMDFFVFKAVFLTILPEISFYIVLLIYLPYSLAWLIKLTPGNIGVQEILMGGATSLAGLGSLSGVTLSILLRVVNILGALCLWFLFGTHKFNK
jgi:uncharacterized membrane protein YbhN (UPF0104 family)